MSDFHPIGIPCERDHASGHPIRLPLARVILAVSRSDFAAPVTAIAPLRVPDTRDIYLTHSCAEFVRRPRPPSLRVASQCARHSDNRLVGYVEVGTARIPARRGLPSSSIASRLGSFSPRRCFETPLRRDDVLVTLLGRALDVAARARERWPKSRRRIRTVMAIPRPNATVERSFRYALPAVAGIDCTLLRGHAERGRQVAHVSEHCLRYAVIEHPVICAVDRGMVKGMLESLWGATNPNTQASLPMGDDKCVTTVIA